MRTQGRDNFRCLDIFDIHGGEASESRDALEQSCRGFAVYVGKTFGYPELRRQVQDARRLVAPGAHVGAHFWRARVDRCSGGGGFEPSWRDLCFLLGIIGWRGRQNLGRCRIIPGSVRPGGLDPIRGWLGRAPCPPAKRAPYKDTPPYLPRLPNAR